MLLAHHALHGCEQGERRRIPLVLLLGVGLPPRPSRLAVPNLLHGLLPPTRLEGGILGLELLLVFDEPKAMGEVEALAIVLNLECLQSLKCLQNVSMQAYGQVIANEDVKG